MSIDHKSIAMSCFNATWDLIDKKDRTEEENLKMIHTAHASRFHWGEIGTALEWSRGEWQLSRVYALVGMGESALYHAENALNYCLDYDIKDFDLAFAYEAMARAHAILGNVSEKEKHLNSALAAAEAIENAGNKSYVLDEMKSIH